MKSKVMKIAYKCRAWAENYAKENDFDSDLNGVCAIASGYLHTELIKNGIDSVIAINNIHTFVIVDNHIIDITATQFNHIDKVVVVPLDKRGKNDYWKIRTKFKSADKLRKHQIKTYWPKEQIYNYA